MGSKQDQHMFNQYLQMLQQSINQANQPSAAETALTGEFNNLNNWFDKKDYRELPAGTNINLLPLAEAQRMRKAVRGGNNTGQRALGASNAGMLAAQREYGDNEFAQNWAGEYENKIGELMGRKDDLASRLMGTSNTRSQNNVANYSQLLNAFLQKPKDKSGGFWSSLLSGGLKSAISFI